MSPARFGAVLVALLALYVAAGKLGLSLAFVNESASAVWPPTGLALAACLVFGFRVWPALFAGAFFVNATTAGTPLTSFAIASGNTLEAVIGAMLVRRFAGGRDAFASPADLFRFALIAAFTGTVLSATIGVTSLALGGFVPWPSYLAVWRTWWLGDVAGTLIVTPVLVLWAEGRPFPASWLRVAEAACLLLSLLLVGQLVFAGLWSAAAVRGPWQFLCLPPVLWAGFRFGQREVATAGLVLAVIAVKGTLQGAGPFAGASPNESLLQLQAFLGVTVLTGLVVGASLRSRSDAEAALEASRRRKDEFLATLGHELRNPLAAIRNGFHVMRARAGDRVAVERARAMVETQLGHMVRLVDDLLDVARIERGSIVLRRQRIDLARPVLHAVESNRPALESAGRALALELPAEPVYVDADETRLAQVFANLLSNAAKFTSAGGRIRVSVERRGDDAQVSVADDGVGIAPEVLPRIFEDVGQGYGSTERSQGGLGLGLRIVKRLVEMHGGSVEAHSAGLGRGSELVVRLPASRGAPPPSEPEPAESAAVATARRVLVVDDNQDSADSLSLVLQTMGHETRTAYGGEEALLAAREHRPEVVLLDLGMPGLDGFEVCRRIRAEPWGRDLRLVALTGWSQEDDRRRSREAGFDLHLVKPVDPDALREALERGALDARG